MVSSIGSFVGLCSLMCFVTCHHTFLNLKGNDAEHVQMHSKIDN